MPKYQHRMYHPINLNFCVLPPLGNRLRAIYILVLYFKYYVQCVIFFIDSGLFYKWRTVRFESQNSAIRRRRLRVNVKSGNDETTLNSFP